MSFTDWLKRWRPGHRAKSVGTKTSLPLREFVYLDEVSLRSLLSSQTGEVTETRSEQKSEGSQSNVDSTLGVGAPGFGKAELASRYQTSNSSSLQTSRKATVQSWFGELHGIAGLRLIEPGHCVENVLDAADLTRIEDQSVVAAARDLKRGALVEFRVRLNADPVFHLNTMVSEFSSIVDESPEMFIEGGVLQQLTAFQPVNKVLQRMLAGLVPIRCEALDFVVIEIDESEYLVRRDCIEGLSLHQRPLQIVGVTEHLAYWKDLRRVLFSEAEFTILGRVARSGLQSSWTAIKLGDLFRVVAPDWDAHINAASHNPFAQNTDGISVNVNELLLSEALLHYKEAFLTASGKRLSNEQDVALAEDIQRLLPRAGTATGQRSAFQVVHDELASYLGTEMDSGQDSIMRNRARERTGLPLFPAMSNTTTTVGGKPRVEVGPEPRLLDVEVVAIYW